MQLAGIECQQAILLLEDHQMLDSAILESVNSILAAGDVPGLYTREELDSLLSPLRERADEDGFRGTLPQYFASSW